MRVITGTARGRQLQTLPGLHTRPTADRVKQALFNILQNEIEGRTVLDLFAGCGQLGIEAVSRGAKRCVLVDDSRDAAAVIRRNLQTTGCAERAQLVCREAGEYCRVTGDRFDLAFLDPPYAAGLLPKMLPLVTAKMRKTGTVVCETDDGVPLPEAVGDWRAVRRERYGRTWLWFYRCVPEEELV